jgi:predicted kinase
MPTLFLLVGPPGSGKSTFAKNQIENGGDLGAECTYVNQDSQGKLQHMENFREALRNEKDVFVDRMNFNRAQRLGYIEQARKAGYDVKIHVFHVPYSECLKRASERIGHETIQDAATAEKAIRFFFKSYERVEDWEADEVIRHYMEGDKPSAIWVDLDGTLCNCDHRRHHVRTENKKKDWLAFFGGIKDDTVNEPVASVLRSMSCERAIVYCSGRGEEYRSATEQWLNKHHLDRFYDPLFESYTYAHLYMRLAGDSRQDFIVKEILLDFEILPRFAIDFCLDDRDQVVKMLRGRGLTVFQVAYGDF